MQPQEFIETVTDILIKAHLRGKGIGVTPDAPFSSMDLFLAYAPGICKILVARGFPGRITFHGGIIRISSDLVVRVGDKLFTVRARFTKKAVREELEREYRQTQNLTDSQRLPRGGRKHIERELEEFIAAVAAARGIQGET